MGISLVVAIVACPTPEHHEKEEPKKYGNDCRRGGMTHFSSSSRLSLLRNLAFESQL
jgi:hypothetical protein